MAFYRITGNGDGSVYQTGVSTHLHGFGSVARSADTCIDYYRYIALLDDDAQEIPCLQAFVRTDRGSQWHNGSGSCLFQTFTQGRVCLAIWQYHKA